MLVLGSVSNEGLDDDFPFSNRKFSGSMLIFQGGTVDG